MRLRRVIVLAVMMIALLVSAAIAYAAQGTGQLQRPRVVRAQVAAARASQRADRSRERRHLLADVRRSHSQVSSTLRTDFVTFRRGTAKSSAHIVQAGTVAATPESAVALPLAVLELADRPASERFGLDFNGVQRIYGSDGTLGWLIPGSSGACLTVASGGGACEDEAGLVEHGIITYTFLGDGSAEYVGMVPASNSSLTVDGPNGETAPVSVSDGVFAAPVASVKTLEVRSVSGAVESTTPQYVPAHRAAPSTDCSAGTLAQRIQRGC